VKKFMLLYNGHATPPEQMSPEAVQKSMESFAAWMQQVGDAIVDMGQPMRSDRAAAVRDDGSAAPPSPLNGYSIIQAADLDAAVKLCEGHPFFGDEQDGKFTVEVFELLPAPRP